MSYDDIRSWLRSLDKGERKVVKSEVARWSSKARKVHAGGRPKVLKPCPHCGNMYGVREMAKHQSELSIQGLIESAGRISKEMMRIYSRDRKA